MATTFELTVSCLEKDSDRAGRILDLAHQRVTQLESELSEFDPASPVSRLNQAKAGERISVPESVVDLLSLSRKLLQSTERAFDCTFRSRYSEPVPAGYFGIACDGKSAWKLKDETRLGFGAIGKGYALDQVALLLEQNGFFDYRLGCGGSSWIFSGFQAPGQDWAWAWSWSKDGGGRPLGLKFKNRTGNRVAIGISGTQEQGEHIAYHLNLRSNLGSNLGSSHETEPAPLSALVASRSCAESDALSTALFATKGKCKAAWSQPAAWIDFAGVPSWNGAFQNIWGALGAVLIFIFLPLMTYADEAVDLSTMGANDFTPYSFERNNLWLILPIFVLLVILLHLKKNRHDRKREE